MAKYYDKLDSRLKAFISEQKIFFVSSSASQGSINLSPKGYDSFRVLGDKQICYLDYPGSGNETAKHLIEDGRLTVMFCSFEKKPTILRVFGQGMIVSKEEDQFARYFSLFDEDDLEITRQIIILNIDSVLTSCGYSIPYFKYKGERKQLKKLLKNKVSGGRESMLDKYLRLFHRILD